MTVDNLILVVDDEPNIRLLVRTALQTEGYPVREASNGAEAIAFLQQESPAVMLLDLRMPSGPDGMAVLEHLNHRPTAQRPRVIVLTAHGGVTEAVKAVRLGASDFLLKPTTPQELRQSVAAAIQESRQRNSIEAHSPPPPGTPPHRDLSYSEILPRIRRVVWNQDINHIEHLLGDLFRKAAAEPAYNNLLGVVFEAEGNRGAAKTFYQKAATLGSCEAAKQNILRLEELENRGATTTDVAMANQTEFLDSLCAHAMEHR